MGKLFFGDNLNVLRKHVGDETVDLIYLDPPFNSNATYNVIYRAPEAADEQVRVFKDTWGWEEDSASRELDNLRQHEPRAFQLLQAMRASLGESDMMAYLVMMAARLAELHRVLKPTGTLYIHCDPTASHYLKIILDNVFGPTNFVNEIIWKRTTTKNDFVQGAKNWPRVHDTLLHYAKDYDKVGNFAQPFAKHSDEYIEKKYNKRDSDGRHYMLDNLTAPGAGSRGHPQYEFLGVTRFWRYNKEKMQALYEEGRVVQPSPGAVPRYKRYLDEMKGVAIGDVWTDISAINSQAQERLGYPTQKPLALLERIIEASSKPGDVVLDPFCGCGTAVDAAEKLGREWIGVDVAYRAIQIIEARLKRWHPQTRYSVSGIPAGVASARALAAKDPHTFQDWAVAKLGGVSKGKGADRGIDGEIIYLRGRNDYGRAIVSVKAGKHINPGMVRDLKGVIARENADIGLFVCLDPPTKEMRIEVQTSDRVDLPGGQRPRIQIIDVKQLIEGPNIGILTQLDPIQSLEAAKALARKQRVAASKKSKKDVRSEPPLPPMAIKGGKADVPQATKAAKSKKAAAAAARPSRRLRKRS